MSFQAQLYRPHDPTNSVIALKDNGQSTRSRADHNRLTKRQRMQPKNLNVYSTMKIKDTNVLVRERKRES